MPGPWARTPPLGPRILGCGRTLAPVSSELAALPSDLSPVHLHFYSFIASPSITLIFENDEGKWRFILEFTLASPNNI